MKKPECFGKKDGYMIKCHEHESYYLEPPCKYVERCYKKYISKKDIKKGNHE